LDKIVALFWIGLEYASVLIAREILPLPPGEMAGSKAASAQPQAVSTLVIKSVSSPVFLIIKSWVTVVPWFTFPASNTGSAITMFGPVFSCASAEKGIRMARIKQRMVIHFISSNLWYADFSVIHKAGSTGTGRFCHDFLVSGIHWEKAYWLISHYPT